MWKDILKWCKQAGLPPEPSLRLHAVIDRAAEWKQKRNFSRNGSGQTPNFQPVPGTHSIRNFNSDRRGN